MDIVCDTNVWYDLGEGIRDAAKLKRDGHRLLATPISLFEISSRLEGNEFYKRSRAAKAVVEHADAFLEDPERHLAQIWGIDVAPLDLNWRDGFKAIADARDVEDLIAGVEDYQERVVRRVDAPLAEQWRDFQYEDFETKVVSLIDSFFPGYARARAKGRAKYMNEDAGKRFAAQTRLPEVEQFVLLATHFRAHLHAEGDYVPPDDGAVARVEPLLRPYVQAYLGYVIKVATKFVPRPNDLGDHECFVYLQDERRLLTSDARWIEVAADSGIDAWLLDPEQA